MNCNIFRQLSCDLEKSFGDKIIGPRWRWYKDYDILPIGIRRNSALKISGYGEFIMDFYVKKWYTVDTDKFITWLSDLHREYVYDCRFPDAISILVWNYDKEVLEVRFVEKPIPTDLEEFYIKQALDNKYNSMFLS